MKIIFKKSGYAGRMIMSLGVTGLFLWLLVGRPEANQLRHTDVSLTGATDILVLHAPKSVQTWASRWNPTDVLEEIRMVALQDRLKRVMSRFPSRISLQDRERLAKMLVLEGQRSGIDPMFLAAVIWVESAFKTAAISHKGARGLMQVMPHTGQEVARWIGIEWTGPDQLHDPEINVRLGVYYLQWLLDLYAGNYRFALTAYNRGPTNLQGIVRRHGSLKSEFTEYFRKIQKAYRRCRQTLYGPGSAFLVSS